MMSSSRNSRTRSRRLVLGLGAAVLVVATISGFVLSGPGLLRSVLSGFDGTPGYSVTAIHVDVATGPDRDVPCSVSADLYVPDHASADEPVPAILATHGFGGAKDNSELSGLGTGFVQEGYAVLAYSGLGFGGSGCRISLDHPAYDGAAGSQLVDVLAGVKPYTRDSDGASQTIEFVALDGPDDPQVGMIGSSYGGQVQFAVAMQDPRVNAIVPEVTWNDLSYSLAPNNADLAGGVTSEVPGVGKPSWLRAFFDPSLGLAPSGTASAPRGCSSFTSDVCAALDQLDRHGYPDASSRAVLHASSVASYVERVKAPTLLVQGEADNLFDLQEATATYQALRRNHVPVAMIWRSFGHSDGAPAPGEFAATRPGSSIRDSYLGRRYLAWMDHYVRGDDSVDPGPGFSYFRNWVEYDTDPEAAGQAVAAAYAESAAFSPQPSITLALSGDAKLVARTGSTIKAGSAVIGDPTAQVAAGLGRPRRLVSFETMPLPESVAVVGSPTLVVRLGPGNARSLRGATGGVLFAALYDVGPDGRPELPLGLVSPVRVTDFSQPVVISLPTIVHRFETGHKLALVLATSSQGYVPAEPNRPLTLTTDASAPGLLSLPLVRLASP